MVTMPKAELKGNKINAEDQEMGEHRRHVEKTFKMPDPEKVKEGISKIMESYPSPEFVPKGWQDDTVEALRALIAKEGIKIPPEIERRISERRVPTTSKATSTNPKDIVGSVKANMLLFPPIALVHAVDAMMDGAGKYDPYNWRAKHITTTNYLHAAIRHIIDYWEGEECAPDSRAKHLGHAIATLGIVLDAEAHGCLINDRPDSDGGKVLGEALAQVAANEKWRREQRQTKKPDIDHHLAAMRIAMEQVAGFSDEELVTRADEMVKLTYDLRRIVDLSQGKTVRLKEHIPNIAVDGLNVWVDGPGGPKVVATMGVTSGRTQGKYPNKSAMQKVKRK